MVRFALLVSVARSGRHIELEPPKQVVHSQGEAAPKFDAAKVALQVDHESFQVMDVSVRELRTQAIDSRFHSAASPYAGYP